MTTQVQMGSGQTLCINVNGVKLFLSAEAIVAATEAAIVEATTEATVVEATTEAPKRKRGRPRKNPEVVAPVAAAPVAPVAAPVAPVAPAPAPVAPAEATEAPAEATTEAPKRKRGRPRKNAAEATTEAKNERRGRWIPEDDFLGTCEYQCKSGEWKQLAIISVRKGEIEIAFAWFDKDKKMGDESMWWVGPKSYRWWIKPDSPKVRNVAMF